MNIWLVMSGEPLEMFGERPHRVGVLSKMLVEKGYEVTWFTTTFDHQHKKYFYNKTTNTKSPFGVNMVFLHSNTPYYKNISFARIRNHKEVGDEFYKITQNLNKPDVVLTAFPTIDLAYNAVKYAKENNIPIIVDIRDLWPDIFLDVLPKGFKWIGKILLKDYFEKTRYIFRNTDFIIGVSEKYKNFGLQYANRTSSSQDKVFPLAYDLIRLEKEAYKRIDNKFTKMGIKKDKIIIWFVGTFGKTYDLEPILKVAKKLQTFNQIQFVFTGDGEKAKEWKQLSNGVHNIVYTGWVNQYELAYLGNIAKIGVMAYKKGAPQGLPNKLMEYCANELAILSSLKGETEELIKTHNIGFTYNNEKELEKYLLELINNSSLRKQMSQNAKKLFDKHFSAEKVYGDMIKYLENIVKNNERKNNV